MIRFLDGPVAETSLELLSAPEFLRVVRDPSGVVDALDQPDDEPTPDEEIYIYKRRGEPSHIFVDWHDGRGRKGGVWLSADYEFCEASESDVRTQEAWNAWCEHAPEDVTEKPATERRLSDSEPD